MRTTSSIRQSSQAVEAHVYSDSALCLGKIHENPESIEAWKQKMEWFTNSLEYRELECIDGEPVEFEWTNFPRTHNTARLLREIQRTIEKEQDST